MKGAEIIPFYGETADRCRERRRVELTAADYFWFATVAFWPLGVAAFAVKTSWDLLLGEGRRS